MITRVSVYSLHYLALAAFSFPLALLAQPQSPPASDAPADQVDVFIGTAAGGNTYPGATLPFGFIQVGPDTSAGGAAGYKYKKPINGFSQQHISGMGGPILGEISVFPLTGPLTNPAEITATGKSAENATPGYYTTTLAPWDVKVELTCTQHVALHRHTFPAHEQSRVLIDVGHVLYGAPKISWNSAQPIGGEVHIDAAQQEVSGFMVYNGGRSTRKPWKVYFVAKFDTPFASSGTWTDGGVLTDDSVKNTGSEIGAYLNFHTKSNQVIQSKVGISWRSIEQARNHVATELPGWDFAAVRTAARQQWDNALSKITVEGGTADQRRMFYTAIYRAHLTPNNWTKESPPRYGDRIYYENFLCLWDTFRTVYPLLTLIQPQVQSDIVNSLINFYEVDGWTGDAHSAHQFEHVQNGSSADVIIADAYVKNLPGIDWTKAYAAIRKNAFVDDDPNTTKRPLKGRFHLDDYRKYTYVPTDIVVSGDLKELRNNQAVSRTLEYAHNDFSVLTLARKYGTPEDVAELEKRQFWYKNLWDKDAGGFMRGKKKDGSWHTPFDPLKTETGPQYYEGHAWTWSWYVPHDPQGLINLHGSTEAFVDKLTIACEKYYEAYNEPCMLETYLFIHAGRPDKTQFFVRDALKHFSTAIDGLPGNDDSATTSTWLVWDLLGLYPNAGQDYYYIGSPSFTKTTLHLPGSKTLVISAPAASPENKYVQSATLNGKPWDQAWLRHADLINGAELVLHLGPKPSAWGSKTPPPSISLIHPSY